MKYRTLIHKYLNGELSDDEIKSFEEELSMDKDLKDQFLIERSLLTVIHQKGRENTIELFRNLEKEKQSQTGSRSSEAAFKRLRRAAFMHEEEIQTQPLPITNDTILRFLYDEDMEHTTD